MRRSTSKPIDLTGIPAEVTLTRTEYFYREPSPFDPNVLTGEPKLHGYMGAKVKLLRATNLGGGNIKILVQDGPFYAWLYPSGIAEGQQVIDASKRRRNPVTSYYIINLRGSRPHLWREFVGSKDARTGKVEARRFATRADADAHAKGVLKLANLDYAVLGMHTRRNPVRDPEHKKLTRELTGHFAKDEAQLRYSATAVDKAIQASARSGRPISKGEARKIHALLKGWRQNPGTHRHSAKFDRCVKHVKRAGTAENAYAVCTKAVGNPSGYKLKFQRVKDGKFVGPVLYFTGHSLSNVSSPRIFPSVAAANRALSFLRQRYHAALRDLYQAVVAVQPRQNPSPRESAVESAARRFKEFSGHDAETVERVRVKVPTAALAVGELDGVLYTTVRDGKRESYIHKFRKNARPLLAASDDGRSLHVLGGAYEFTEAGIEDR